MLSKKMGLLLVSVFVLPIVVSGCGNQSTSTASKGSTASSATAAKPVNLEISWWGVPEDDKRYLAVIKLFEQKYPNVHITTQYSGWSGYWTKLSTESAGHNLPQIVQMDISKINPWVNSGLIKNLQPFEKSGDLNLTGATPTRLDAGKVDGKLYSIPLGFNAPVFLYNPKAFQSAGVAEPKPGMTWQDYINMAEKLKSKLGKGHYVPALDDYTSFQQYLRDNGQWVYNSKNTGIGFKKQTLINFLEMWVPLQKKGVTPPGSLISSELKNNTEDLIVKGMSPVQNAMWSSQVGPFSKLAGHTLNLSMYPMIKGGTKGEYLKPSLSFTISRNTTKSQANWSAKFISFFVKSKQANNVLLGIRGPSMFPAVNQLLTPKLTQSQKSAFKFIDNVLPQWSSPIYPAPPAADTQIGNLYQTLQQKFDFQKITPTQFANQFISGMKKYLANQ